MLRRRPAVQRRADGTFTVQLAKPERALLKTLADQMSELLTESPEDPSLRRLSPTAYPTDPERDAEYQLIAGEELRTARQAALDVLVATAERKTLDEDELVAWMQTVNGVRLVLGTRLDVSEDDDHTELDPASPDAAGYALYHYLGVLLHDIVSALAAALPPSRSSRRKR